MRTRLTMLAFLFTLAVAAGSAKTSSAPRTNDGFARNPMPTTCRLNCPS